MLTRITCLSVLIIASISFAVDMPAEVSWRLQRAFIPTGFDNNDKVQIVVTGEFPNTCFRVGPYKTRVDKKTKVIHLQQKAYVYPTFCLQILIPFTQTIDVGLVENPGEYSVVDDASHVTVGHTSIAESRNPGPDDHLYAVVNDASIRHVEGDTSKHEIALSIRQTDTCMELDRIDVHYYDDVLVAQPIMRRNESDPSLCVPSAVRYEATAAVKAGTFGSFLLHVRSINGQAINKLVDL